MRAVALAALLLLAGARVAAAAEIRVLTAGAFRAVLEAAVPAFEQRTGDQVRILTETAGGVAGRIDRGEAFDLAILTPATAAPLVQKGKLAAPTPVAAVGIGVAVAAGAPKPNIGTVDAFKAALLAARAVAMIDPAAGGSSGIYMVGLFDRLGIGAQMRPKLILVPGGLAVDRVASGDADMAIQQQSELMGVRDTVVVGPIPAAVQNETVYVAAANPARPQAAAALLATLTGPEMGPILAGRGMHAP